MTNLKKIGIMTILLLLIGSSTFYMFNKKESNDIVVTTFIAYDIVHEIVGDKLEVTNIMPWGSEMHDYEPSSTDLKKVSNSRLFIYLGEEQEPWVKSLSNISNTIDLSRSYSLADHNHHHEDQGNHSHDTHDHHADEDEHSQDHNHDHNNDQDHNHDHNHDHGTFHYWTDPTTFIQLLEETKNKVILIDPENKEYYENRAEKYIEEVFEIHIDFDKYMQSTKNKEIYFSGHNAMDAFADRYHLKITSLTEDYRPNADPTASQILSLKNEIKSVGAKCLFIEELVEPRIANTIKDGLSKEGLEIELLELHGYHNISYEQFNENVTYLDLFKQNVENIKYALSN